MKAQEKELYPSKMIFSFYKNDYNYSNKLTITVRNSSGYFNKLEVEYVENEGYPSEAGYSLKTFSITADTQHISVKYEESYSFRTESGKSTFSCEIDARDKGTFEISLPKSKNEAKQMLRQLIEYLEPRFSPSKTFIRSLFEMIKSKIDSGVYQFDAEV